MEGICGPPAREVKAALANFPLYITRDLDQARRWLRSKCRGAERMGLLASSNAARLKPHGVFVTAKIEPAKWFLAPSDDVRSSDALEDAETEFDMQGLELDWTCLPVLGRQLSPCRRRVAGFAVQRNALAGGQ